MFYPIVLYCTDLFLLRPEVVGGGEEDEGEEGEEEVVEGVAALVILEVGLAHGCPGSCLVSKLCPTDSSSARPSLPYSPGCTQDLQGGSSR